MKDESGMTEHHPLTPPPELIQELAKSAGYIISPGWLTYALEKVFQAGADQELEACLRYAGDNGLSLSRMRAARRPKPPSWKEQALARCNDYIDPDGIIRRALEALDD
jgi:hypothetical protein